MNWISYCCQLIDQSNIAGDTGLEIAPGSEAENAEALIADPRNIWNGIPQLPISKSSCWQQPFACLNSAPCTCLAQHSLSNSVNPVTIGLEPSSRLMFAVAYQIWVALIWHKQLLHHVIRWELEWPG